MNQLGIGRSEESLKGVSYSEFHGDLVSGLIMELIGVIGVISLLTKYRRLPKQILQF